jgi:hypothetical protein
MLAQLRKYGAIMGKKMRAVVLSMVPLAGAA